MGGKVFRQPDKMYYSKYYEIPLLCYTSGANCLCYIWFCFLFAFLNRHWNMFNFKMRLHKSAHLMQFMTSFLWRCFFIFWSFSSSFLDTFPPIDHRLCRVTPATLIKMFEMEWFPLLNNCFNCLRVKNWPLILMTFLWLIQKFENMNLNCWQHCSVVKILFLISLDPILILISLDPTLKKKIAKEYSNITWPVSIWLKDQNTKTLRIYTSGPPLPYRHSSWQNHGSFTLFFENSPLQQVACWTFCEELLIRKHSLLLIENVGHGF